MASKKPLLSPIPEIPEVFSSVSSPNSPKANALFSGDVGFSFVLPCSFCCFYCNSYTKNSIDSYLEFSLFFFQFSNIVPDAKCGFDPSDYSQQYKETPWVKEAKESVSLMENEQSAGNLLTKAEGLTGLEFLDQEDSGVQGGAPRTWCPHKDSARGLPSRRRGRRSSTISFPPVETLEMTENNLPVSSFNIDEVLSAPQVKSDSFEPFRRKSENCGEKRVRRSMRLHKDAAIEGLAWVQVPSETQKNPPLVASGHKIRRTISTPILVESENIHHREHLPQLAVPGKENNDSGHLADDPSKRWRRKSTCVSTPQETRTWSQTRRRSITKTLYRRDRSNHKH
ncbi:CDCA2 protein, partial [Brachypteracias leptosomus]|nr:CDCA2 protein [Brachypteracias leptosomus]